MKKSIFTTVLTGLALVMGPVLILGICGILIALNKFSKHSYSAVTILLFPIGGFVLAWVWWAITIPKWRL